MPQVSEVGGISNIPTCVDVLAKVHILLVLQDIEIVLASMSPCYQGIVYNRQHNCFDEHQLVGKIKCTCPANENVLLRSDSIYLILQELVVQAEG